MRDMKKWDWTFIIGFICLLATSGALIYYGDRKDPHLWYVLISVSILLMFSSKIREFNLFGLVSAKMQIRNEAKVQLIHINLQGLLQDCSPAEREAVNEFFLRGKVGETKDMLLLSDFSLKQLQEQRLLSFIKTGHRNNTLNEARQPYSVTLKRNLY